MYRNYCNERGCPGHVKNWESCLERRLFAGRTGAAGPILEFIAQRDFMSASAENAPPRALAAPVSRSETR